MSDFRPLLECGEAPPEVIALLRSARPTRPLDERARERSRRRLAGLAAVPAAAGVFVWLQHAAYGALLGVAVTGSVAIAPRVWSARAPEGSPPAVAPRSKPRVAHRGEPARTAERAVPSADAPAPLEPKSVAFFRTEPGEHALAREAKSLDHARALAASDPLAALAALGRHRAEFPHGTLDIERQFLEIEALVHLGRRAEAENAARALRARAPGSLYESRVDQLMAGGK